MIENQAKYIYTKKNMFIAQEASLSTINNNSRYIGSLIQGYKWRSLKLQYHSNMVGKFTILYIYIQYYNMVMGVEFIRARQSPSKKSS